MNFLGLYTMHLRQWKLGDGVVGQSVTQVIEEFVPKKGQHSSGLSRQRPEPCVVQDGSHATKYSKKLKGKEVNKCKRNTLVRKLN